MERLHHQHESLDSSDSTNLPSILSTIAARRHSIFGHIRRLPDRTPAHMTLKLAVNTRSAETHHTTAGIAQLVGHGPHG